MNRQILTPEVAAWCGGLAAVNPRQRPRRSLSLQERARQQAVAEFHCLMADVVPIVAIVVPGCIVGVVWALLP